IKWIAALPSYVSQITGGAASLAVMTKALQNANTSLTTLTAAAPLIDSTNMNLGEANTISDYISENYVYPNACAYQSSVNAPQGCVQPTLTNKSAYAIYPTCNNQQPPIAVFSPAVTVGQFGSGADISVGGNLLGNIVHILTQTINGQNTVVCMSPGTPAPANAVPPAAKK
ncbi:MAG: hypothetical protein HYX35_00535, partial [Proteobacteria bacterium]|nr:hypothetical protein [Pseudomonadota bacterium]